MIEFCECNPPQFEDYEDFGIRCGKCKLPVNFKSTEEIMKAFNEEYYRKHKPKIDFRDTQANLTPVDMKEVDRVLEEDAKRWAENLNEKQIEQATDILEKKSYFIWLKNNLGSLTPKQLLYSGIGAALSFMVLKFGGCF